MKRNIIFLLVLFAFSSCKKKTACYTCTVTHFNGAIQDPTATTFERCGITSEQAGQVAKDSSHTYMAWGSLHGTRTVCNAK